MSLKTTALLATLMMLLFAISSCSKINEELQRDIFVSPASADFTIPVIATTFSGTEFAKFDLTDPNFDALIKQQLPEFGAANITSAKLKGVKIKLLDTIAANNTANIENISVYMLATGQDTTLVASGSVQNIKADSLVIPISGNAELKEFLKSPPITYILKGKLRKETTAALKAKATVIYTLSLKN